MAPRSPVHTQTSPTRRDPFVARQRHRCPAPRWQLRHACALHRPTRQPARLAANLPWYSRTLLHVTGSNTHGGPRGTGAKPIGARWCGSRAVRPVHAARWEWIGRCSTDHRCCNSRRMQGQISRDELPSRRMSKQAQRKIPTPVRWAGRRAICSTARSRRHRMHRRTTATCSRAAGCIRQLPGAFSSRPATASRVPQRRPDESSTGYRSRRLPEGPAPGGCGKPSPTTARFKRMTKPHSAGSPAQAASLLDDRGRHLHDAPRGP